MDKDHKDKSSQDGKTVTYDEMDEDMDVVPDKEAYDKSKNGNDKHPAHKMGEEGYPQ